MDEIKTPVKVNLPNGFIYDADEERVPESVIVAALNADTLEIITDYIAVNRAELSAMAFAEKHNVNLIAFRKVAGVLTEPNTQQPDCPPSGGLVGILKEWIRQGKCQIKPIGTQMLLGKAIARIVELETALEDMTCQFAHWADGAGGYSCGGLSALEHAFAVLGWTDPQPCPAARCQAADCLKQATCGSNTPEGYKHLCSKHYSEVARAALGDGGKDGTS